MDHSKKIPFHEVTILIHDYHASGVQALLKRAKRIHTKDDKMTVGCTNYWSVDHEVLSAYLDAPGIRMKRNKIYNGNKEPVLEIMQHDTEHKST